MILYSKVVWILYSTSEYHIAWLHTNVIQMLNITLFFSHLRLTKTRGKWFSAFSDFCCPSHTERLWNRSQQTCSHYRWRPYNWQQTQVESHHLASIMAYINTSHKLLCRALILHYQHIMAGLCIVTGSVTEQFVNHGGYSNVPGVFCSQMWGGHKVNCHRRFIHHLGEIIS